MNVVLIVLSVCFLPKNRGNLGQLVTSPMTNFTRAKVTHFKSITVNWSMLQDSVEFTTCVEKGHLPLAQILQEKASSHASKNLKAILKTIVFYSRQNIALRWHNESSKSGHYPSNFRALLEFHVEAGDMLLGDHFSYVPKNAPPMVQSDLINCCGEWIQRKLIQEVFKLYISICADEAADSSNRLQLPLIVCFVEEERNSNN